MTTRLLGAVEAGGSKFVCAVGTGPDDLRDATRFPTTTPEETIGRVTAFFQSHRDRASLTAVGVAAFGPVDLDPASPTYGFVTSTPKPGWSGTDLAGAIGRALGLPIGFDTDVNGAGLAEWRWGAGRRLGSVLYVTVGTGVGGGLIVDGRPLHGLLHPEMGHMRLPRDPARDPFAGCCPYHGDCLEGLACGVAMEQRWGQRAEDLPEDHQAWDLEAEYLALACHNWIVTLSPEKIIFGGSVMGHALLLARVRRRTRELLADYVQASQVLDDIDDYIVAPSLGSRSGVLGAIALAARAFAPPSLG
jgi:fructokinase